MSLEQSLFEKIPVNYRKECRSILKGKSDKMWPRAVRTGLTKYESDMLRFNLMANHKGIWWLTAWGRKVAHMEWQRTKGETDEQRSGAKRGRTRTGAAGNSPG